MATYMSVERTTIQTAFAKAHRLSQSDKVTAEVRKEAQTIARLIWDACGERKEMPGELPIEAQMLAENASV